LRIFLLTFFSILFLFCQNFTDTTFSIIIFKLHILTILHLFYSIRLHL